MGLQLALNARTCAGRMARQKVNFDLALPFSLAAVYTKDEAMKALAYLVFLTFLPPRPAPSMERLRQQRRLVPRRPRRATESYPALATQVARLGNGQYSVLLAATGDGASECGGMAVSRWSPDRTTCVDGFHVFLRDLEDDFVWSAGYQPMRVQPDAYEFRFSASLAEIVRVDRAVACRLPLCVAPEHDFE